MGEYTNYLYVALGFVAIYLIYWVLKRKKILFTSKKKLTEEIEAARDKADTLGATDEAMIYEPVKARVYDATMRTIYNKTIKPEVVKAIKDEHGTLGRKWWRNGKWVYALNRKQDGKYQPIIVTQTMDDPPDRLHRALQQQEVAIVYAIKDDRGFLEKYWHILLFIGAIMFFMWTAIMK